jgi:uncharacterized protein (TIGR00661 family)
MSDKKLTVLIAPLDWGMGHVTRCIPIIQYFIKNDFLVIVAVNQVQEKIIVEEKLQVEVVFLKGYQIQYSSNKLLTYIRIFFQIPKILLAIRYEKKWLHNFCINRKIDLIISDNRYGFYHQNIHSVFITHQLQILTGTNFGNWVLQKINYYFINKFNECWIPDSKDERTSIAGKLSHPKNLPLIPIQYLGLLTRFENKDVDIEKRFVLIILSGPEPQRTLLEMKILRELETVKNKIVFIRGVLSDKKIELNNSLVTVINFANSSQIEKLVSTAEFVICRSGYSSLMDYLFLKKKMLLIPTPGQTEQEYLSKYLQDKSWAIKVDQNKFSLNEAILKLENANFQLLNLDKNSFQNIVHNQISNIKR